MTALLEFWFGIKMKLGSASMANMANIGCRNSVLGLIFLEKGLIRNNLAAFHHIVIRNGASSNLTVVHIAIL